MSAKHKKITKSKRRVTPRDLVPAKNAKGGVCTTPRPGGPIPIPYPN